MANRTWLADLSAVLRRRPQDAQMAPPAYLDALADRLAALTGPRRFPDRVGQRLQVVGLRRDRVHREPHELPAARGGQSFRMGGAQVVAVRLHVSGERAEHGGGVTVDVGQCVQGRLFAGRPGAATGHHRWARLCRLPVAARPRTPPEAGARASGRNSPSHWRGHRGWAAVAPSRARRRPPGTWTPNSLTSGR